MHRNLIENREIRIFISSTFSDMQAERDRLVNAVFPSLRRMAAERDVALTVVDLRWGITAEESENGRVIPVCLGEIDRSRPFFIGLIGDRYGWVPDAADVPDDCRDTVADDILLRRSITEMEFRYGVFRSLDPVNAAFYIKADNKTVQADPRIAEFKKAVLALPDYPKNVYDSLDDLAEAVTRDFIDMLDRLFPVDNIPDKAELRRMAQRSYMREKTAFYVPIESYDCIFDDFMRSDSSFMAVTSAPGMGKSALLSHLALRQMTGGDYHVETYFATGELSADQILDDIRGIRTGRRIVVFVDTLDAYGLDFAISLLGMSSSDMKIVAAATAGGNVASALRARNLPELDLRPLLLDERIKLATGYLSRWSKRLDTVQTGLLTGESPVLSNPAMLVTLLSDIRTSGNFEQLSERISRLASTQSTTDFYSEILANMDERLVVPKRQNAVSQTVLALAVSSRPVAEDDLIAITAIPRLYMSQILALLDSMVTYAHNGLSLSLDMVRDAVIDMAGESGVKVMCRRHYMRWYRSNLPDARLRLAECAYKAHGDSALFRAIGNLDFLDLIIDAPGGKRDFIRYWNRLWAQNRSACSMAVYVDAACVELCAGITPSRRRRLGEMLARTALWLTEMGDARQTSIVAGFLPELVGDDDETASQIMSIVAVREQNFGDAFSMMARSLSQAIARYGRKVDLYDHILAQIADTYHTAGEKTGDRTMFEKAVMIYEDVLDARIARLGENDRDVALVLDNLSGLMSQLGDKALADRYGERALKAYTASSGNEDDDTARTLSNMAVRQYNDDDRQIAGKTAAEAVKIYRRLYGDMAFPAIGQATEIVAAAAAERGQYQEAAGMLAFAEECARAGFADDYEPWKTLMRLQQHYIEAMSWADVERLADEIEGMSNEAGAMHGRLIAMQDAVRANALAMQGRDEEALLRYDDAIGEANGYGAPDLYLRYILEKAKFEFGIGHLDDCDGTLSRAVRILEERDETESSEMAYCLYNRSLVRYTLARHDDAMSDIKAAIDLRARLFGDDDAMLNDEYRPKLDQMRQSINSADAKSGSIADRYAPIFDSRESDSGLRTLFRDALDAFDAGHIERARLKLDRMRPRISESQGLTAAMVNWLDAYCIELGKADDDKAEELYRSAIQIAETAGDVSLAARIGHDLCEFFWNRRNYGKAWRAYIGQFINKHYSDDHSFRDEYITLFNCADAASRAGESLRLALPLSIIVMHMAGLEQNEEYISRAESLAVRILQQLDIDVGSFIPDIGKAYTEAVDILADKVSRDYMAAEALAETAINPILCSESALSGDMYLLGIVARKLYDILCLAGRWNRLIDMTSVVAGRLERFDCDADARDWFVEQARAYRMVGWLTAGSIRGGLEMAGDNREIDSNVFVQTCMLWNAYLMFGYDDDYVRQLFESVSARAGELTSHGPAPVFMLAAVADCYDSELADRIMGGMPYGDDEARYYDALYNALTAGRRPGGDCGENIIAAMDLLDTMSCDPEGELSFIIPLLAVLRKTRLDREFDAILARMPRIVDGIRNDELRERMLVDGMADIVKFLKNEPLI
ncbi:MAG: DUF4062 domain-containing protein [Bacteroidales bacterium]|nr:DUF4062 domain-containing protein [Bacteroidales bacterium]